MSSAVENISHISANRPRRWSLWLRQIGAIFRLEIEKNFLGRRSILMYLIALLPLFPCSAGAVYAAGTRVARLQSLQRHLRNLYNGSDSAHGCLLRLRVDLHEPVSR